MQFDADSLYEEAMTEQLTAIWMQFRGQLMADKKKSAVLGVLFVVLLIVAAVKGLSISATAPNATEAADLAVAPAPDSTELIRPSASIVTPVVESMYPAGASQSITPIQVESNPEDGRPVVRTDGMSRSPHRDLFATSAWAQFPPALLPEAPKANPLRGKREEDDFWSTLGKRMSEQQEERRRLLESIEQEISELALLSTMTGSVPLAHISGRVVRPGDSIQGFSVVCIEDRRVMLEKSGIRRVLRMP